MESLHADHDAEHLERIQQGGRVHAETSSIDRTGSASTRTATSAAQRLFPASAAAVSGTQIS